MELNNQSILDYLKKHFPHAIINSEESFDMLTIETEQMELKKMIQFLKETKTNFHFLTDICGVHYPNNKGKELGVVYHLQNMQKNVRVRIKCYLSQTNPKIDSLVDLYPAANWMERETYDFYGIQFVGHPDLRTILNMDDLGYHPLLKHYPLEDATRTDKNDAMFGR